MRLLNCSMLLVISLGLAPLAHAGSADICYATPVSSADCSTAQGCTLPTSSTPFVCPNAGTKTVPQLAASGWSLVQLLPVTYSINYTTGVTMITQQIVIQKP